MTKMFFTVQSRYVAGGDVPPEYCGRFRNTGEEIAHCYRDVFEHLDNAIGAEARDIGQDADNVRVFANFPDEGTLSDVTKDALRFYAEAEFKATGDWPFWLIEYAPDDVRREVSRGQHAAEMAREEVA